MTKMKNLLTYICLSILMVSSAMAIGVPEKDEQIKQAKDIVCGTFEVGKSGAIYFYVKSVLKGNVVTDAKILITSKSKLGVILRKGGGVLEQAEPEFRKTIQSKEWFTKEVILLGTFANGHWTSDTYDWSVWPTGEVDFKSKSLDDVKQYIAEKVK